MRPVLFFAIGVALSVPGVATAQSTDAFDGVDVAKALAVARIHDARNTDALAGAMAEWQTQMAPPSGSPYDEPDAFPRFTNELYWEDMLVSLGSTPGGTRTPDGALDALRWDLGITRARPGKEIPAGVSARVDVSRLAPMHRDPLIVAAIAKAGVDADIFSAALAATTERHSTVAASYAVAAQIIRDRSRRYPRDAWKRMGIRSDVVDRLIAVQVPGDLEPRDRTYLSSYAAREMNRRRAGRRSAYGLRELSTTYRIARIAAAYRDGQSYFSSANSPCEPDGDARRGIAGEQAGGDTRPLCFAAASDRAVYRWYADELWDQAHDVRVTLSHDSWIPAMFEALVDVLVLVDLAAASGFAETLMADELVEAGVVGDEAGERAFDRQNALTCRIP